MAVAWPPSAVLRGESGRFRWGLWPVPSEGRPVPFEALAGAVQGAGDAIRLSAWKVVGTKGLTLTDSMVVAWPVPFGTRQRFRLGVWPVPFRGLWPVPFEGSAGAVSSSGLCHLRLWPVPFEGL